MADNTFHTYRLTFVRDDGKSGVTEFSGYYAETCADRLMKQEIDNPRSHWVYARLVTVNASGVWLGLRREWKRDNE